MGFVSGAAEPPKGEGEMRSTWAIGGQEVRDVVEGMIKKIWKEVKGVDLEGWFRVMPYEVAMDVVSFFFKEKNSMRWTTNSEIVWV